MIKLTEEEKRERKNAYKRTRNAHHRKYLKKWRKENSDKVKIYNRNDYLGHKKKRIAAVILRQKKIKENITI